MTHTPPAKTGYFAPLRDEQFIVLTTFRPSGTGVPTTVWFAEDGGNLYISTQLESKKVARIRTNAKVLVTPSDRVGNTHGTPLSALARLLEPGEYDRALTALQQKYGAQYQALTAQMDAARSANSRTFLEITASGSESA